MPIIEPKDYASCNSEHGHQGAVFIYFKNAASSNKHLSSPAKVRVDGLYWHLEHLRYIDKVMYAIPNGGEREKSVAGRMKIEGVRAGVPDFCLPLPVDIYHGLYIEMKRPGRENESQGGLSDKQLEKVHLLTSQLYRVSICYDWYEAVETIRNYIYGLNNERY